MIDAVGIFDKLKEENGGVELPNDLKDRYLESIDTEVNEEGKYIDAFGNVVSFNGIFGILKGKTKLNISKEQENEIIACASDYKYFRRNYCKIVSKIGIQRPEPREYQERLENQLLTGEDTIVHFGRQSGKCSLKDTLINIINYETKETQKITVGEFHKLLKEELSPQKCERAQGENNVCYNHGEKFSSVSDKFVKYKCLSEEEIYSRTKNMKPSEIIDRKFIEVIETSKYGVLTETGYEPIVSSNKTIEYEVFEVILEDGFTLKCANTHILITSDYNEIFAKDSLNSYIRTEKGPKKVLIVRSLEYEENMYDLSIDSKEQTYYTNGILSHNTVTVATYLLWLALFKENKNIGIAANVQKLAVEVLDKIKKIYVELPVWLQAGITVWNKQSVELSNGVKILTSATNGDSFRGYSIHVLYVDEAAFIRSILWHEFADSVFPAQDALAEKQTIISSTPNGLNHYYHLVEGARANSNGYHIVDCHWTEVPRWNKDGTLKDPETFKKEQVAKNGIKFWNQNFGCVGFNTKIDIKGIGKIKIGDLYNSM